MLCLPRPTASPGPRRPHHLPLWDSAGQGPWCSAPSPQEVSRGMPSLVSVDMPPPPPAKKQLRKIILAPSTEVPSGGCWTKPTAGFPRCPQATPRRRPELAAASALANPAGSDTGPYLPESTRSLHTRVAFFIGTHQHPQEGMEALGSPSYTWDGDGEEWQGGGEAGRGPAFPMVERGAAGSLPHTLSLPGRWQQTFLAGPRWAWGAGCPAYRSSQPGPASRFKSNNLQPETPGPRRSGGGEGTYLEARGPGRREEIGGKRGERHSLADGGGPPRGAGSFGGDQRRAAPGPASCPGGGAGARTYPVDLGQPPLLPGLEHAERLPPWRDKGAREAGARGAQVAGGRGRTVRGETRDQRRTGRGAGCGADSGSAGCGERGVQGAG